MKALLKLTAVEAKLYLREPVAVFWGLAFPALVLALLGVVFPGFLVPNPDLGGVRLVDTYVPILLSVTLATVAFGTLPTALSSYRELGVLRRLATTPIHPGRLLVAQLVVQMAVASVAALLVVSVASGVFRVPMPELFGWSLLSFLLTAASLLTLGLLVGAVARTVSAGQGMGMAVYFPMLFFAGVYFPRESMPDGLRRISDLTPIGAGVQAMQDAWNGTVPAGSHLLVMAASAVIAGLVAAMVFRWT